LIALLHSCLKSSYCDTPHTNFLFFFCIFQFFSGKGHFLEKSVTQFHTVISIEQRLAVPGTAPVPVADEVGVPLEQRMMACGKLL
jgi:hypothetical protein